MSDHDTRNRDALNRGAENSEKPYRDRQEGDFQSGTGRMGAEAEHESSADDGGEPEQSIEEETQNEERLDLSQEGDTEPDENAIEQETQHARKLSGTRKSDSS